MNLAALQLDIRWEDRPANHRRVRERVRQANLAPQTLLILPEMFDVGFSMNTAATRPEPPSISENFCIELAREFQIAVLAGVVTLTESGTLANEAIAFSSDGVELARYRKMQPFTLGGEPQHYPAGDKNVLFDWAGVRIAPFICYDLRFPELFRPAAIAGAELIIVIASWPFMRSEHWVRLLQARAIENQAYVMGVNRTGSDPHFRYDGRSSLFDPHGREVFQCSDEEQIKTATIDAEMVRQWRREFPAIADIRHR